MTTVNDVQENLKTLNQKTKEFEGQVLNAIKSGAANKNAIQIKYSLTIPMENVAGWVNDCFSVGGGDIPKVLKIGKHQKQSALVIDPVSMHGILEYGIREFLGQVVTVTDYRESSGDCIIDVVAELAG